ncbi:MAG: penicillin-binding protein activator [Alphaproteobacteria bacterium]|nr:penicillin-binding protein activator [Alphaproteobacteria bacterium]
MKQILSTLAALLLLAACTSDETAGTRKALPARTPVPPLMKETTIEAGEALGVIPPDATPIKVGILLPLSGDAAALGNAMLDAATLALYDEYMSVPSNKIRSQIILVPKDTGKTANSAAAAAEAAIADGATFIVGPLFSQAVTAMKPLVKAKNIPVISFSNNRVVAEPNIYTYGYLPEQQIARIAEYAYLQGYQRVALLAPNDAYGIKVRDELSSNYSQKGGFVAPAELYAPSELNIDAAVARLLAAYQNTTDDRKFQAIFIADSGFSMKNLIKSLKRTSLDFSKIKLIGAGLWDDPELTKIPELHGTIFPGTPPESFTNFEKRFTAMYGYKPVRLASLSYDVISLLAKLSISSPAATIDASKIPDPDGFHAPANNLYRLMPDGTSDRKLAILEVTPTGFKVVEPASKRFAKPGE